MMNKKRISPKLFFLTPFAFFTPDTIAQSDQIAQRNQEDEILFCADCSEEDSYQNNLVVTATKSLTRRSEVGSSISVITAADIEAKQFQFAADALSLSPGVTLARNSAFGGVSSINLRGSSSRQTLVLIDGIVVNDPSSPGGAFNFANLDVTDVERIEVLRGPQSVLYGSEAIGGVVSIRTQRAALNAASDGKPSLRGYAEAGSFATVRAGLGISGIVENFDYRASVYGTRTDGISRADFNDGNTERDGFKSIAASANLGYAFTPTIRAESFLRYGTSATEFDGFPPPNFTLADSEDDDSVEEITIGGRIIADFLDKRFKNTATIGYSRIERTNFSGDFVTFDGKGDRLSLEYLANFKVHEGIRLIGGAETERTFIDTGDVIEDIRLNSFFGLAEFQPLRNDYLFGDEGLFSSTLTVSAGVRLDDHETFGSVTTARVTGAWEIPQADLIIRGSWGEGFSAPSLFQLNFVFGDGQPNRNLQPEETQGWDVGFEKQLLKNAVTLSATYFNQNTDNLIDFNFLTGAFFNINASRQRGVETELTINLPFNAQFASAYTYTQSIDRATGLQALRQPRHRLVNNLDVDITDAFALSVGLTYNGSERDTDFINDVFIDDFIRLDLRGRYSLSERLELFGRIENLTDTEYQDVLGFGEPGISAFGGFRVKL